MVSVRELTSTPVWDALPARLLEQAVARNAPAAKALAAYGLLVHGAGGTEPEVWLRFVSKRPVSGGTTAFLAWCCDGLWARGTTALLLIWDNASWQLSREVRGWIRQHLRLVKETGTEVRIIACFLPSKSPWLNPIEPRWLHAKRRVLEPARVLSADELERRVYAAFQAPRYDHLTSTNPAA